MHVAKLYKDAFANVPGITFHDNPSPECDSNFWLNTILIDEDLKVKGQELAYAKAVKGAVGGAAGVTHEAHSLHTAVEPNANVEAMRVFLDKAQIESRPLWKPMHCQPVFKDCIAYTNGVSESLFRRGLCLPSGPMVTDEDVTYIVENILAAIER
jgi:dTDP-4-amino-4,6-dideoxygalactose transaminase